MKKKNGFKDVGIIIKNFILTCLFYFPGMIHALYIRKTGCGLVGDVEEQADLLKIMIKNNI